MGLLVQSLGVITLSIALYSLIWQPYTFDPEVLQSIAYGCVDRGVDSIKEAKECMLTQLRHHYNPSLIGKDYWNPPIFNQAGGSRTSIHILHASLTEYVLFWHSAIETKGFSGRHFAEFYDWVVFGKMDQWNEFELDYKSFGPRELVFHPKGHATFFRLHDGLFTLEYSRGIIPSLLPFGLVELLVCNLDFITVVYMMQQYLACMVCDSQSLMLLICGSFFILVYSSQGIRLKSAKQKGQLSK